MRLPASRRSPHHALTHNCVRAVRVHSHAAHAGNRETSGSRQNPKNADAAPRRLAAGSCPDDPSIPPRQRQPDNPPSCHRSCHPARDDAWCVIARGAAACHAMRPPPSMSQLQSAPTQRGSSSAAIAAASAHTLLRSARSSPAHSAPPAGSHPDAVPPSPRRSSGNHAQTDRTAWSHELRAESGEPQLCAGIFWALRLIWRPAHG